MATVRSARFSAVPGTGAMRLPAPTNRKQVGLGSMFPPATTSSTQRNGGVAGHGPTA